MATKAQVRSAVTNLVLVVQRHTALKQFSSPLFGASLYVLVVLSRERHIVLSYSVLRTTVQSPHPLSPPHTAFTLGVIDRKAAAAVAATAAQLCFC